MSSHVVISPSEPDGDWQQEARRSELAAKQQLHRCDFCPYYTSWKTTLERHMRTHTGEKPYKCPFCTYASAQSATLVRHVMVHTGERPYKCPFCTCAFIQNAALIKHIKTAHSTRSASAGLR